MIQRVERKHVLAAAAVTVAAAAAMLVVFMETGFLFFLPLALIAGITRTPVLTYVLPLIAVPLAAVVFWRRPWWVRWAFLGILLHNLGLTVYLQLTYGWHSFSD